LPSRKKYKRGFSSAKGHSNGKGYDCPRSLKGTSPEERGKKKRSSSSGKKPPPQKKIHLGGQGGARGVNFMLSEDTRNRCRFHLAKRKGWSGFGASVPTRKNLHSRRGKRLNAPWGGMASTSAKEKESPAGEAHGTFGDGPHPTVGEEARVRLSWTGGRGKTRQYRKTGRENRIGGGKKVRLAVNRKTRRPGEKGRGRLFPTEGGGGEAVNLKKSPRN